MEFDVVVTTMVNSEIVMNAVVGAFEGGSTEWIERANLVSADNWPDGKTKLVWWGHESLYEGSFVMEVEYADPESGGKTAKKTIRYPEDFRAGLQKMANNEPDHFHDLVQQNDDAITHDVMMQEIVLGEVVYG